MLHLKLVALKLHGGNFRVEYIRLGKTNILVSRVAFGGMRLTDSIGIDDAASIVRKAYDTGINFFDTARKTPKSEQLLGDAVYDIRKNVLLSTSTTGKTSKEIKESLEESLMALHCDCIDLFQIEIEKFIPQAGGADKIYETLLDLQRQSKIKHFGIVTTNLETAEKVVLSDLYETIQFPFNILSSDRTVNLVKLCEEHDVGFIAMQPLGGGIVENIPLAYGFLNQFENVVPLWGIKKQEELEQIIYFNEHPPIIDEQFLADVEKIKNFFN